CAVPRAAAGFHPPRSFEKTANDGGGGGVYATGAPRAKGYDCAICHVDAPRAIAAELASDPPDLAAGSYTPGVTYQLTVRLVGEHAGFGARSNQNGFLLEIDDDADRAAGAYVSLDPLTAEAIDDGRVVGGAPGPVTSWQFRWRAPAAGAGAL